MPAIKTTVIVHDRLLMAKLFTLGPGILVRNRALVTSILETVKAAVQTATPEGPGHFGYHGRDTLKIDVSSKGPVTRGKLLGAVQLYWREYGTRGYFRKGSKKKRAARAFAASMSSGGFGEPAFYTAHKAAGAARRLITFYYGSMAAWWKSG